MNKSMDRDCNLKRQSPALPCFIFDGLEEKRMTNKEKAHLHFWPELNGKCKEGWLLHHKDPSWKMTDPKRYKQWNIEDLIPMTVGEHNRLHMTGTRRSEETRKKLSELHIGKKHHLGCHHSEETRKKMSDFHKLVHWWNNGKECKLSIESPGEDWVKGRLLNK